MSELNPNSGPAQENGMCGVRVDPAVDDRSSADNMGYIHSRPVYSEDAMQWIEKSLLTLQSENLRTEKLIILKAYVKKLYVYSTYTQIVTNIVLKVDYQKGSNTHSKLYRGSDASTEWLESGSEARSSFEEGMEIVIEKIKVDIKKLCQNLPLA